MVSLDWYVVLSLIIFFIGMFGFLSRRNIIMMLISIELMLNAVNISFVAYSHYIGDMAGHIMVFLIIAVAASEAAIGLALVILMVRNKETIFVDGLKELKW
ncbi:MAG: NADH-quinone oxidoreductase subunit NuoK [Candidatus Magnetoovum sp. WYHC-5]|nr:NADH-quinone oxidoreductase subunit NuoK [Candidatus Magnetoovum sp. WYHC-5]